MKTIRYSIIILTTLLLAWLVPDLYHLATDKASKNTFCYYSSVEKSFCIIEHDATTDKLIRKNIKTGKEYTEAEFGSILPMFYYRQLLSDGRMPDSVHGIEVSPKWIGKSSFFFRYAPTHKNTPHIPLYTLFESMSGRVKIDMPGDVFRIHDKIEFIDPETNSVNKEKSEFFMKLFTKKEFSFPALLVAGNPSTRKAYDEGYFILDSKNKLFHLKMVNGKPFLKDTQLPSHIKPVHIESMEPNDKSFYAFLFDESNKLYMISTNNYNFVEIPCPSFDVNSDRIMIMANPLYWNINALSEQGKSVFALKANSKQVADSTSFNKEIVTPTITNYVFPFQIKFKSATSEYIKPTMKFGRFSVLFFNFVLILLFIAIKRSKKQKIKIFPTLWIMITGIFGFIPCLILNN